MAFTADEVYGTPGGVASIGPSAGTAAAGAHPSGRAGDAGGDPHDPSDKGPADFFEDPVIWLVLAAAVATGVIGFRFHAGGGGAEARVQMGDEIASVFAQAFFTMVAIVVFKTLASKVDIPGLQQFAAAI